jgi:protein-disulfide isomerase
MSRHPMTNAAAALALALLLAGGSAARAATPPDTSKIKEVDFGGLSEAQTRTAIRIMSDHPCNCGCNMTIAICRERDSSCRRSLIFARTIVDALREGKSEAETVKVLQTKASTFVEAKLPDDAGVVYNIDVTRNPVRGPKSAPITIVEFSDFQCPYCASLQPVLEQVLKTFPKDVRLIFKQYPLNIHQYARQAAAASLAAHAQGKFWPMHDKMFQNFGAINEENISKWAKEVGLNMPEFEKAMQSGQHDAMVQKDLADGASAKVLGTPTVFVNGKKVQGQTFEAYKKVIQEELAAARPPAAPRKAEEKATSLGNEGS